MKHLFFSLFLLLFCLQAQAQQPDMPEIQPNPMADSLATAALSDEEDDESVFNDPVWDEAIADGGISFKVFGRYARDNEHYRDLAERFERADTTLIWSDFLILYYGYAYRDEYTGGYGGTRSVWNALIKEKRHADAYDAVTSSLKNAPATPYYLADALNLAYQLERPAEEIHNLEWRMYVLLDCIYALGDGTREHPWPIINVSDEYTLMYNYLGVQQVKGQTLINTDDGITCDRMEIEPVDNDYFTGSEVWFDVDFPFPMMVSPQHWANKLTGKENVKRNEEVKKEKKRRGEEN